MGSFSKYAMQHKRQQKQRRRRRRRRREENIPTSKNFLKKN
jgi:U3 small nucleolar ribonucleoprotein component